MKSLTPALAVCLAGIVLAAGSAVALATSPPARGGHAAVPKTTKAPHPPKRVRGQVGYLPAGAITVTPASSTPAAP